ILTEVNSNIGVLSARRLAMVTLPALMGNTFVIKAHAGPGRTSRLLQSLGLLRITYIYRDPRDAMLSAFEYGQRALQKGHPNAFSHLTDFQTSLDFIMGYVRIWERWVKEEDVLIARYEDLLTDYDNEVARLTNFLKIDQTGPEVREVIERYRPGAADGQQGLHFHKGRIGRFREFYGQEEQAILKARLGQYLSRMGYAG
ncbi:MAG TPA: sulfotransferase domain-containing protein, partial [Anaerolineales bacterium]|nr:sulfotransferase domain-containing protein [Anaerolineales bacterium]